VRAREPGERRDHYAVHDDVWTEMYTSRMAMMSRWEQVIADGVDAVGADSPAGRRLEETREFFAYIQTEIPGFVERWQERKAARGL
jgi:DNA-binding transcriptional regulator GbsR (MarR family)